MATGRTPRELLACVDTPDIAEMMAFERLEPFGALADEFRLGVIASTVANVHRQGDSEPFSARDFMPALRRAIEGEEPASRGADLDPEALSRLIDATIFGRVE